ncbi:hypothetical protein GN956_G20316 [Arapaima gigas]
MQIGQTQAQGSGPFVSALPQQTLKRRAAGCGHNRIVCPPGFRPGHRCPAASCFTFGSRPSCLSCVATGRSSAAARGPCGLCEGP